MIKVSGKTFVGRERVPPKVPPVAGYAVLWGPDWAVLEDGDGYQMTYQTGGLVDVSKTVSLSPEEVEALRVGNVDKDTLIRRLEGSS